jgi:hypothetical protein
VRSLAPILAVMAIGLVLLADYLLVNPLLAGTVALLTEYLVLLAAAAAVAGALALGRRHVLDIARRRGDRIGSLVVLASMGLVLAVGLAPGAAGADAPPLRWLVAAVLIPLAASFFALIPIFAVRVVRRGTVFHGPEATLMLVAAAATLLLLLPLSGPAGGWLATAATLLLDGPLAAVFRGLLIATAVASAVYAARLLFGIDATDD